MSSPAVSVIMPAYNAQGFVREAVESILGQTFGDFELLVVNDGSTDGTLDILRSLEKGDGRLRVISRPNTGYVVALNEMLHQCRAPLVARMDADDIALRRRFELQVRALGEDPGLVCVSGGYEVMDAQGRRIVDLTLPQDDASIQQSCLQGHSAMCHPAAMMRREAALRVGGYDTSLEPSEDLDLWLKLGEIGRLANIPEVVLRYRVHSASVSEKRQAAQRAAARRACENAWRRRGIQGTFAAQDAWRPGNDPASRHRFAVQYGWWAFQSGERGTAMRYAARAIAARPGRADGWKLMACAAAKKLPSSRVARAE